MYVLRELGGGRRCLSHSSNGGLSRARVRTVLLCERGACVRRMLYTRSAYDAEKRLPIALLTSRGLPETRGFPWSMSEEQPVLLIRERRRAERERLLAVCLPET